MTDAFNPQEILKIAINVETNGEKLYEALENKTTDEKIKDMWHFLKEQEVAHREVFTEMLNNQGDYIVNEGVSGEFESYVRAIASEYIFTQELVDKKREDLFNTDLKAIDFAIYIEKESIVIYSAFKEYISTQKQPVLDKVIAEERNHLVKLTLLKDYLTKGE